MRAWARDQSLSLVFLILFLAALVGQSYAGHLQFNEELREHGDPTISWSRYVVSSQFGAAVMENWQSEFLQFTLFIAATIWLVQRGSNESKKPEDVGRESDQAQRVKRYGGAQSPRWSRVGGLRLHLYQNSLLYVMGFLFIGSWFGSSVTEWTEFNGEQLDHRQPTISWLEYIGNADFWEKSLQNWQSEFLAVGCLAVFTIYLRQRGSPESKPVGAPHDETGSSG
jgi:Domain of unknown function (DUF6766)